MWCCFLMLPCSIHSCSVTASSGWVLMVSPHVRMFWNIPTHGFVGNTYAFTSDPVNLVQFQVFTIVQFLNKDASWRTNSTRRARELWKSRQFYLTYELFWCGYNNSPTWQAAHSNLERLLLCSSRAGWWASVSIYLAFGSRTFSRENSALTRGL